MFYSKSQVREIIRAAIEYSCSVEIPTEVQDRIINFVIKKEVQPVEEGQIWMVKLPGHNTLKRRLVVKISSKSILLQEVVHIDGTPFPNQYLIEDVVLVELLGSKKL